MCLGGGDSGPVANPAPYTTATSHSAVTFDKTPAPVKPVEQEVTPKEPDAAAAMVGTGLNVKGM